MSTWALCAIAALSAWSFLGLLPELRYWASAGAPRDIGRMGAYQPLESIPEGVYAHVEGIASPKRGSYSRFLTQHEVFPLIASRLLVDRRGAPVESLRGYAFPYRGEGRLSRAGSRYEGVREQFAKLGELPASGDVWVLEDGVVPRRGLRIPLEALFWSVLVIGPLAVAARRSLNARKQP